MRRWILFAFLLAAVASVSGLSQSHNLKVKLTYQADGEVNSDHRLWVFVWDTPDFTQGDVIPVSIGSTTSNGGVVEIAGLSASTIYLTTMYDEAGGYLAMGPPNTGTPVGMYGDATGPTPIKLGENSEVEVYFDDSFRMP